MKKKVICLLCTSMIMGALAGCAISSDRYVSNEEQPIKIADLKEINAKELTENLDTAITFDAGDVTYEAVHGFSYELLKHNLDDENPVISPVSAYAALAMAGNGARGETLEEFYDVIGNNLTTTPYELLQSLQREEDGMIISLANSAWVDEQLEPAREYLTVVDSYFGAEVYQQELSSQETMKDMNTWVNAKTKGMIPAMVNEPLEDDSRLVLFNTIYFNGKWQKPFKGYDTAELDFTMEDGNVVSTDMMRMYDTNQLYVKNELAEGVILPYAGGDIVFLALMPKEEMTVREMYERLTWGEIRAFLDQEERTLCNLRLPKFEVTFEKNFNDSLKEMGLKKAFDSSLSDLSGLGTTSDRGNLYISLVKQKAVLILDEEGTEASAATMVEVKEESAIEYENPPINVYFDRPFLYMIVDRSSDVPLFMGIMDRPGNFSNTER